MRYVVGESPKLYNKTLELATHHYRQELETVDDDVVVPVEAIAEIMAFLIGSALMGYLGDPEYADSVKVLTKLIEADSNLTELAAAGEPVELQFLPGGYYIALILPEVRDGTQQQLVKEDPQLRNVESRTLH